MISLAMRPGSSNMLQSQSTLLCLILVCLQLSVANTHRTLRIALSDRPQRPSKQRPSKQRPARRASQGLSHATHLLRLASRNMGRLKRQAVRELQDARTDSESRRVIVDLDRRREIHSRLFRRSEQDLPPERHHEPHPPPQLIEHPGSRHFRDPDGLGPQRPGGQTPRQLDLGPHRPSGQVPPDARLTRLEILSVQKLGQRLSNRIRRDVDIGPHRPGGQHPIPDPHRPRQSPTDDSDSLWKNKRRSSGDVGRRTSGQVFSQDVWQSNIDIGPQRQNGQFPRSLDLGPQRPHGQHPPKEIEDDSINSIGFGGQRKRVRRNGDFGPQRPGGHVPQKDEVFAISGETYDNSQDNDIEVSPYTNIFRYDAFDLNEDDGNGIYLRKPHDLGPHRPMGSKDPNGLPSPPDDLGPQRPSGQVPPSTGDFGPPKPCGQHPPENARVVLDATPVDLGPQRPSGATDPNGVPSTPSDLGPQRPSGQHPPSDSKAIDSSGFPPPPSDLGPQRPSGQHPPPDSASQPLVRSSQLRLSPGDLGPHRPSGATDPNGVPSTPTELGPQRPSGQHLLPDDEYISIAHKSPASALDFHNPLGQHLRAENILEKIVLLNSPPSDLGPHRPSGNTDPNGVPSLPNDLGPQRPSGQHPPSAEDLGPQRPSGQHPPERAQKVVLTEPLGYASQKIAVFHSPSDLGPHRPSGNTDPNGIPSAPSDLGPQRPSGQHPPSAEDLGPQRPSGQNPPSAEDLGPQRPSGQNPPSAEDLGPQRPSGQHPPSAEDLGPQRPSGQHPPESAQEIVLTEPLGNASQKIAVFHSPSDLGPHRPSGNTDPNGIPSAPSDLGPQRPSGQHPPSAEDLGPQRPSGQHPPSAEDLGPQRPSGQHPPESAQKIVLTEPVGYASQKIAVFHSPSDLGPHRPSGNTDPNGIPSAPSDLGPQRPSGQHPPSAEDLGPQRPSGQHPPSAEDLGPQRPSGQHPPESAQKIVLTEPVGYASQKIAVFHSPSDLGPHRPNGNTDPNGIPSAPSDLGPQRPSGQHPPSAEDLGPQRPFGQHQPSAEDLGPHRPSGQHPPERGLTLSSADPLEGAAQTSIIVFYPAPSDMGLLRPSGTTDPNDIPSLISDLGHQNSAGQHPHEVDALRVTVLHAPSVDLGPQRPSGYIDANGPLSASSDFGPQRPSGQHPPQSFPMRIESNNPVAPMDLGPHRPAGPTDPNIKPGLENDQEQSPYNVYWNVPTFMCHKHGYRFRNLSGEYGIVQNPNDAFRGTRVAILYDPGLFPAVLQDEKGQKFLRNGGVPQEGDLQKHLGALEESIEEQVPKNFDGLGVIDFEAWRPVWAQNWGALNIYRTVSMDLEKRRDPSATRRALEIRAKARFEAAARVFFEATMQLAQQLRPRGRWGFYGFPHCFNQVPSRPADYTCAPQHQLQNDKIDWLWKASTALYPSVYLTKANKTAHDELAFVSGRLSEAQRVAKGVPVYAYVWYRYHDSGAFLTEDDLRSSLLVPRQLNLAGTILWGSSSDLNNREKCARFSQVLQESIGPAIVRATRKRMNKDSPTVIFAT